MRLFIVALALALVVPQLASAQGCNGGSYYGGYPRSGYISPNGYGSQPVYPYGYATPPRERAHASIPPRAELPPPVIYESRQPAYYYDAPPPAPYYPPTRPGPSYYDDAPPPARYYPPARPEPSYYERPAYYAPPRYYAPPQRQLSIGAELRIRRGYSPG